MSELANRYIEVSQADVNVSRPLYRIETLFIGEDFTREQVVEPPKEFMPIFEHEEKGKVLNLKMLSERVILEVEHGYCRYLSGT